MTRLFALRDALLAAVTPLGGGQVPLPEAGGRFLAAPAVARLAAPPETCSAMDGYAVRAAEVAGPVRLPVHRVIYAGDAPGRLPPGQAARIFTGAGLPDGADAVVREESVEAGAGEVAFRQPARLGENVRRAGEDVTEGAVALPAGARLGPRQLALLAAVGLTSVEVVRRPRVALISTGDEIVGGRTPDSNGVAVAGLCRALGAEVERSSVEDRLEAVEAALADAATRADAVLTIGGVSVGERDHVRAAARALGADIRIHGVPMKPGKPFLFALRGALPVFGLPGSPSACLVAFEVFVRPALLALAGAATRTRPALRLRLAEATEGRPGRARLLWARLEEGGLARPIGRDEAQLRAPALADLLLPLPAGAGDLPEGAEVTAWLLDDAG